MVPLETVDTHLGQGLYVWGKLLSVWITSKLQGVAGQVQAGTICSAHLHKTHPPPPPTLQDSQPKTDPEDGSHSGDNWVIAVFLVLSWMTAWALRPHGKTQLSVSVVLSLASLFSPSKSDLKARVCSSPFLWPRALRSLPFRVQWSPLHYTTFIVIQRKCKVFFQLCSECQHD